MFDVITFGSATYDIFLKPKKYKIIKDKKKFIGGNGICFDFGSKIDVEFMYFSSGGGGTNTAVTFAKQNLKTAFIGKVGNDIAGKKIVEELSHFKINSNFLSFSKKKPTNHSIIIGDTNSDRTIFVFKGASDDLSLQDIPFEKIQKNTNENSWFYLAPLSGKASMAFEGIVNFAKKNKIKIAVNPGNTQLRLPHKKLINILNKTDILFLNQEEASILSGIPFNKDREIIEKLKLIAPIVVITKGKNGAVVLTKDKTLKMSPKKVKIIDKTGAGDAFASGFLSSFIANKGDVSTASDFALENASACISQWGAKNGLLDKNRKLKK